MNRKQRHEGKCLTRSVGGFFFIMSLAFSYGVTAQSYTTLHFSVSEGLPSSEVYEVYQDKKGFIWFATDNGVARYDGREFQVFHVKDGLTDPVVFGFFEDDADRIWFRTFSGRLCYFDGDKILQYPYNNELRKAGDNGLFRFAIDNKTGELWFTLEQILGKIDSTGQIIRLGHYERGLFIQQVDGKYLLGADTQFAVSDILINERKFPIQLSDTTDFRFFNTIEYDRSIYISIYRDLFQYRDGHLRRIFSADAAIISLSTDRQNNLWLGYLNRGAEVFAGPGRGTRPVFLRNQSVTKVLQNPDLGMWFSTLESGAYYIPDFTVQNYSLAANARVKSVELLNNTVLVGDQSGELYHFNADTRLLFRKQKFPHPVYCLFVDSQKNFWLSADVDLMRVNSSMADTIAYLQRIVTCVTNAPDGSVWTLGGIRISHFDSNGALIVSDAPDVIYRTMYADDSAIYLAGRTGLHVRDLNLRLVQRPPAMATFKITKIHPLNDTTLLLATQGNGLVLANKYNWQYVEFNTTEKFLSDNIYSVATIDSTLWMGTEQGVVAIEIRKLLRNQLEFFHISERTGLIGNKINFVIPVKETVWAFADQGFSVIPRSRVQKPAHPPIFYIKKVIGGADTLTSLSEFSNPALFIPFHNNHVTFTFGYISFSNQDLFLRYRLTTEDQWVSTSERTIQFLSLAPGDYRLQLQYSADNLHWNEPFQPLQFTVDSPWWLKWYALSGMAGVVLLFIYAFFRHRQSIYKQRNHYLSIINSHQQKLLQSEIDTLERERIRIARELHDGVGTNLTAIKLMVNQLLQNHHREQAAEVEEQFQIALRELKDIIYNLTPPALSRYGLFTALENYVSKLNKSLAPSISLQVFGQEIRNYEFNILVFRIVQELISNSFKHSSANNISIHINSFEDVLNIVYEDDGVGFSYDGKNSGLGLDNIESRLHSVNGILKFESNGRGVFYTIDVPVLSIRAETKSTFQ